MKNKNTMNQDLNLALKELRLPTMKANWEKEAKHAEKESFCYEEYLLELTQQEIEKRRQRKIERRLFQSHLPDGKRLENFHLKRLPLPVKMKFNALLQSDFVRNRENVLVFGKPGSGKTHLLCALSREMIFQGHSAYYSPCSQLIQELLHAKQNFKLPQKLKKLSKYEILLIDDIGYVEQSREEMEVLFILLADSYERRSILLTSNLPFSKWDKIFKDPMTTAAAIDRLVHHSIILDLDMMDSYRMEEARKREAAGKM